MTPYPPIPSSSDAISLLGVAAGSQPPLEPQLRDLVVTAYRVEHVDEFAGPAELARLAQRVGEVDVSELGCGGEREAALPL